MRKFFQTISYKLNRLVETVGTFGWVALSVNDILVLQLLFCNFKNSLFTAARYCSKRAWNEKKNGCLLPSQLLYRNVIAYNFFIGGSMR